MQEKLIAPSILSADFARLGEEVDAVLAAGADIIHFDVMDNHFVPNLTFGPTICKALRNYGITAPIDAHLMTEPVDDLIVNFAKAGATYISFHPNATPNIENSIKLIHDHGCKAGIAINPDVSLDCLKNSWDKIELVLLMSVFPGFGGQKFIHEVLPKIKKARAIIDKLSNTPLLEIDGGVGLDNIKEISDAGANIFVAGSAIFSHKDKYQEIISNMQELIK